MLLVIGLLSGARGRGARLAPRLLDSLGEAATWAYSWSRGAGAERTEGTVLRQRALFAPKGLWGRAYWYSLLPFHTLIFRRMAQAIADAAAHVPREDSQPA